MAISAGREAKTIQMDPKPVVARQRRGIAVWLRRYAPAEIVATLGALLAAGAASRYGSAAVIALAGVLGETVAFYGYLFVRDLRSWPDGPTNAVSGTVHGLLLEFGPAELSDTLLVRPLAMYLGPFVLGGVTTGILAGKVAADVVFYALAVLGYELLRPPPRRGWWSAAAPAMRPPKP